MTTGPVHSGDWKLGGQNNGWVPGHSERLPSIARFVEVWLLLESQQQRANIEQFTLYDYFTQILDFISPVRTPVACSDSF